MLRTALGMEIAAWLDDQGVVEIMLNPDGRLWLDRLTSGLEDTGARLSAEDGERIIRLVAHHVGAETHEGAPRVSAELPETGERFEGLLPPIVYAPAFSIRKPAVAVFSLDDYVTSGVVTKHQGAILKAAIAERKNVLVAGGTSTGKTTLANALLAEVAKSNDRVVLIEDTRELQCAAPNLFRCAPRTALRPSPTLFVPHCAFGPIAFRLAKCGAAKRWICSRLGARAIQAASAPFTRVQPSARCAVSNSSSRKPSSPFRARSSPRPSRSSPCLPAEGLSAG